MDLFEELRVVTLKQSEEGEFPAWLMADVIAIVNSRERYANSSGLVEELTSQIRNYDPYAGAGCFDISVSAGTIESTIKQIMLR